MAAATNEIAIKLPRPHAAQAAVLRAFATSRFGVVVCGRRWGKTEVGKCIATKTALNGKIIWWVSPTYTMSVEIWDSLKTLLVDVTSERSEVDRRLKLITGGILQVKSATNPDSLRGAGLDLVVLDEAAYMQPDVWRASLRPALSDKRGKAIFLSTPNGRNWFWELWMLGSNPGYKNWFSCHYPTSANPLIHPEEIEDARQLLPQRIFEQEYLAEFLEDSGAVFRGVTACIKAAPGAPEADHEYVFGVDWAKDNDFTVIAVMDRTTSQLVALDRFNSIGWSLQRGRLAALYDVWKPSTIWAEENSIGGPNIEALQNEGLPVQPFSTTAQTKAPLIESLALAFERQEIGIVNDPVLIGELQAYTMDRLPSGRFAYSAPAGMHDDTVIATALAWHGALHSGIGIAFF